MSILVVNRHSMTAQLPILWNRFLGFSIVLLSILFLVSHPIIAQSQHNKDSLLSELRLAKSNTKKVDVLNALAYEYYDFNDSIGYYYARQALELAKQIDYPYGLQYAYTMVGVGYFSFGDYENAIENFIASNDVQGSENNLDHYLYTIMLSGNVMADIGRYDSAQNILLKGLDIAKKNNHVRRASIHKSLARMQARLWLNKAALENIRLADSIRNDGTDYERADIASIYATIYLNQADLINAERSIQNLCSAVAGVDDYFHKSLCFLQQSELSRIEGHYSMALNHAFQALDITEIYNYPYLRAQIFLKIGEIYSETSEFEISMQFLFRTLKVTENSKIHPLTAQAYSLLSWIFMEQKNFTLALDYANRSEKLRKQIGDRKGIANAKNMKGLIYLNQKNYSASLAEHESVMQYRDSVNDKAGIAATLYNMALVYEEQNNFPRALEYQIRSLEIDEELGNPLNVNLSYIGLAGLLIKMNRLAEAESYLLKSKKLAEETGSKIMLRSNYRIYAQFYESKGDFKNAYFFSKKFNQINDSIYFENSNLKIAEMQSLYDVERKEQQIELLSKEKALQENQLALQKVQITNQTVLITAGGIVIVLIGGILLYIVRTNRRLKEAKNNLAEMNEELMTQSEELRESNDSLVEVYTKLLKQQDEIQQQAEELKAINNDLEEKRNEIEAQAEELREANETISTINQHLEEKVDERTEQLKQAYIELDTFFYRSSHDFRRPITTFIGLAEVAKITSRDEATLELFSKVKETALSLDRMIRKLQTISDVGAQKMVYKEILVRELVANILTNFSEEIDSKKIKVIEEIELKDSFKSYGALVHVILENLIENAIQFSTPLDPFIRISASTSEKGVIFKVEDNGQGIPEEYHQRIFDMYLRASISSKGNGLGLYIVKKAIEKLEGTIRFETKPNEGTCFIVELPVENS